MRLNSLQPSKKSGRRRAYGQCGHAACAAYVRHMCRLARACPRSHRCAPDPEAQRIRGMRGHCDAGGLSLAPRSAAACARPRFVYGAALTPMQSGCGDWRSCVRLRLLHEFWIASIGGHARVTGERERQQRACWPITENRIIPLRYESTGNHHAIGRENWVCSVGSATRPSQPVGRR